MNNLSKLFSEKNDMLETLLLKVDSIVEGPVAKIEFTFPSITPDQLYDVLYHKGYKNSGVKFRGYSHGWVYENLASTDTLPELLIAVNPYTFVVRVEKKIRE